MKIIPLILLTFITVSCVDPAKQNNNTEIPNGGTVVNLPALPSFKVKNVNGEVINLKDAFKGKKVFVNLWATWCPPCRAEMPALQQLYSTTDSSKVAFVFLSMDDDFTSAIKFMQQNNFTLPAYFPAENLPAIFNVDGIPDTFIFDAAGKLIHQQTGMGDYTSSSIKKLLQ